MRIQWVYSEEEEEEEEEEARETSKRHTFHVGHHDDYYCNIG